ncbi:MAG TPA: DUF4280 domain-containing protein [Polyangiaceae bacterium]|nr:DUF4280 domain-containing protein [Polyangiaceae bacterium]
MALPVCAGAPLQCSFGAAPSALAVLPTGHVLAGAPVANITDSVPLLNIMPFGVCSSLANPSVAAATAAALGALVPMPCVPATAAPWIPTSPPKVMVVKLPVLQNVDKLMCTWGGVIQVVAPAQTKVVVK